MKHSELVLPVNSRATIVQIKNTVLESNLLEVKAIEHYQHLHPSLTVEEAAMTWIARNAARWRRHHPLLVV
jgi:hypothetical protein